MPKFHTGGIVGNPSGNNEIFAKLLEGEFVITPTQSNNLITKLLPSLMNNFGERLTNNETQNNQSITIQVDIAGNPDDTTISKLEMACKKIAEDIFKPINSANSKFGNGGQVKYSY